jgi:hypothetical protein
VSENRIPVIKRALQASKGLDLDEQAQMIALYLNISADMQSEAPLVFQRPAQPPLRDRMAIPPSGTFGLNIDDRERRHVADTRFDNPPVFVGAPQAVKPHGLVGDPQPPKGLDPNVRLRTLLGGQEIVIPDEPPAAILRAGSEGGTVRDVDTIFAYLQQGAPSGIKIPMPKGGTMAIGRNIQRNDLAGIVKLAYSPAGGDPVAAIFSIGEQDLDLAEKLADIIEGCRNRFSAEKREVRVRQAAPRAFSLATAVGSEGDDGDGAALAQSFTKNRSQEEIAFIKGH